MKRSLLITFVAICMAGSAFAAAGSIGVFSDLVGGSCTLTNDGPGPLVDSFAYIVHTGSDGTTGCSFSAPIPICASGIVAVDIPQVPVYLEHRLRVAANESMEVRNGENTFTCAGRGSRSAPCTTRGSCPSGNLAACGGG